jgi:hypothetical protein
MLIFVFVFVILFAFMFRFPCFWKICLSISSPEAHFLIECFYSNIFLG